MAMLNSKKELTEPLRCLTPGGKAVLAQERFLRALEPIDTRVADRRVNYFSKYSCMNMIVA